MSNSRPSCSRGASRTLTPTSGWVPDRGGGEKAAGGAGAAGDDDRDTETRREMMRLQRSGTGEPGEKGQHRNGDQARCPGDGIVDRRRDARVLGGERRSLPLRSKEPP